MLLAFIGHGLVLPHNTAYREKTDGLGCCVPNMYDLFKGMPPQIVKELVFRMRGAATDCVAASLRLSGVRKDADTPHLQSTIDEFNLRMWSNQLHTLSWVPC